jgi:hypothetical protein
VLPVPFLAIPHLRGTEIQLFCSSHWAPFIQTISGVHGPLGPFCSSDIPEQFWVILKDLDNLLAILVVGSLATGDHHTNSFLSA